MQKGTERRYKDRDTHYIVRVGIMQIQIRIVGAALTSTYITAVGRHYVALGKRSSIADRIKIRSQCMFIALSKLVYNLFWYGLGLVMQSGKHSREIETEELEPLTTITKTYLPDADSQLQ